MVLPAAANPCATDSPAEAGWAEAGLERGLGRALVALGYSQPLPIQQEALRLVPCHEDTSSDYLVRARTGSGKTLALLLPLLNRLQLRKVSHEPGLSRQDGTFVMLVAPTRELASQTHELLVRILAKLRPHWITSLLLCGGQDQSSGSSGSGTGRTVGPGRGRFDKERKHEKEALRRGATVVVGTPGRILDHLGKSQGWRRSRLAWLVLDEADRLLDAGFAPKLRQIYDGLGGGLRPSVIYCSATVSNPGDAIVPLREQLVLITDARDAESPSSVDMPSHLGQYCVIVPTKQRLAALVGLLRQNKTGRTVVFLSCCDTVDYFCALFRKRLVPNCVHLASNQILGLHGSLPQDQRRACLQSFRTAEQGILFCTDVAARGLNFDAEGGSGSRSGNVSLIVQFDAPTDRLDYVHRAGRTARGLASPQQSGRSVLVLHESEADYLELLGREHGIHPVRMDVVSLLSFLQDKTAVAENKKSRFGLWLKELTTRIGRDAELKPLARKAYTASLRAYATHPADEKPIFHPKRLHFGHLASAFGLDTVESSPAPKTGKGISAVPRSSAAAGSVPVNHGKREKPVGSAARNPHPMKRPRTVSEFSAY